MFKLVVLYFVMVINFNLISQKNYTYAEIDSISYFQCMNNDWSGIRNTLKKAEADEIDFFFLYMRAGMIAFNHKNYEFALKQFKHAALMNPADQDLQLYQYLSMLKTNRFEDAREFGCQLPDSVQEKYAIQRKDLFALSFGTNTTISKNISTHENINFNFPDKKGADVLLKGNVFGTTIQFQMNRKFRTYIFQKFAFFKTNSLAIEQIAFGNQRYQSAYKNTHFQYNLGVVKIFKNGLNIGAGFGFFRTNFSHLLVDFYPNGIAYFSDTLEQYNNILFAATIGKRFGNFQPAFSFHYNNLYGSSQFQFEGACTYYPWGNTKIFGSTAFSYSFNSNAQQQVFVQKIGVNCTNWLWMEGKFSLGNLYNYMSNLGFVAYNTADKIVNNTGLDFHFLYRKFELIIGYALQTRVAYYTAYPTYSTSEIISYNYQSNNLITTVKWNF